ncbi:MAG: aryl-sulfate sulfotransferase [Acidimicrobiales bacterium]
MVRKVHGSSALCVALLAANACSGGDAGAAAEASFDATGASTAVQADGDGILGDVEVTVGPHSTISALVEAETTEDAVVTVEVSADHAVAADPPATGTGTSHRVPVVGMRAETDHTVTVTASGDDGGEGSASVSWTTGSLPEDLPPLTVDTAEGEAMASGVTLFNALTFDSFLSEDAEPPEHDGFVLAVDETGEVVWYYRTAPAVLDVAPTQDGTLLLSVNDTVIREIDLLGNTVRELATRVATDLGTDYAGQELLTDDSEPITVDSSHHELFPLDNGNLMTFSTELIELDPGAAAELCPGNPEPTIVADVVVELTPEGEVAQEWPLADVFDPVARPGVEMCVDPIAFSPPTWFYPPTDSTRDWTHANSVVVDEDRNLMLLSLRHLDAVVALRYHDDDQGPAGELLWELGAAGSLAMAGDGSWPYHQHAVQPQADTSSYLLYDNGNYRPGTSFDGEPGEPPYSRAVLYDVDEEAGTVRQLWEHRDTAADGRPVYAGFLGDADRLENGDVLITHGAATEADGSLYARLVEVVPGDAADGSDDDIVFDLTVGGGDAGWMVYRSDRFASLYAPGALASEG